jgi:hypothetical protein
VPVGLTWVFGKKNSHFETGPGLVFLKSYHATETITRAEYRIQWKFGYRFQKLQRKGINASVGLSPTYAFSRDDDYWTSDGFLLMYTSVGYSF